MFRKAHYQQVYIEQQSEQVPWYLTSWPIDSGLIDRQSY